MRHGTAVRNRLDGRDTSKCLAHTSTDKRTRNRDTDTDGNKGTDMDTHPETRIRFQLPRRRLSLVPMQSRRRRLRLRLVSSFFLHLPRVGIKPSLSRKVARNYEVVPIDEYFG